MTKSLASLFASYHTPSSAIFEEAWNSAHFALDANVLLNLYRYSKTTREQMLSIIKTLGGRIWVPHQAALEFERNRLSVIAEQRSMFGKVREIVSKNVSALESEINELRLEKRHSTIDPKDFLAHLRALVNNFDTDLTKKESVHIDVFDMDQIYEEISGVMVGRVGPAFESQKEIDGIASDYDRRAKLNIPPGFRDRDKASTDDTSFAFNNINYPRQAGDLILWNQIKNFSQQDGLSGCILVTDDRKDDWWYIIKSSGKKTIGPRPELRQEFSLECKDRFFWMYTPERFAEQSRKYLRAKIDDESVQEIKQVSSELLERLSRINDLRSAEAAVCEWIEQKKGKIIARNQRVKLDPGEGVRAIAEVDAIYSDYITGDHVGVEVKRIRANSSSAQMALTISLAASQMRRIIGNFS